MLTNRARPRPSLDAGVGAHAPDVAGVAAGGLQRRRDVAELDAGRRGQQLGGPLDRQRPGELGVDRQRVAGEHRHPHARARHRAARGMPRILRLSLRSFCSSSVSNEPSSTSLPANGSTLKAIGRANFSGSGNTTAPPSWVSSAAWSATWRTCLSSSSTPASPAPDTAWYVLATRRIEPGLVVQRLEHRHRRHRRAVGVGDDALAGVGDGLRVDLGHDERHVGVHAERRGVVDDRDAGGGEPRRQLARRRGAGREQGDVEARRVGGRRRPRR